MRNIELHVRDVFRVGRPPIGRAQFQLFGINPIQLAVQQSGAAILGEPRNLERRNLERIQVVTAPESHSQSIGGELGVAFRLGRGGELLPDAVVECEKEQIAVHAQQQLPAGMRPLDAVFTHTAVLPIESRRLGNGHCGLLQRRQRQQRLFRFCWHVVKFELAGLKIGEMLSVRRPDDVRRFVFASLRDHRVDGDRLLLREQRNRTEKQTNDDALEQNQADQHLL